MGPNRRKLNITGIKKILQTNQEPFLTCFSPAIKINPYTNTGLQSESTSVFTGTEIAHRI